MKAAFHTLGCKVNQYETEALIRHFKSEGYEIAGEQEFADVYIINTCTVTGLADRKSRQYIRRMKKINPESVVVVTGCYAQISPEEVTAIEGVDIVAGTNEKSGLPQFVRTFREDRIPQVHVRGYGELDAYEELGMVTATESRTRAYIKIQEGCNRFCSYCVIPYARGKVRSRKAEDILSEAEGLIGRGFKEIILTGINTALYGTESGDDLEKLIANLSKIPGDFRIRLSSLEPTVVNSDYVKGLLKYEKLCHHLHLSLQSGSDRILQAMNRPYGREDYLEIIRVLREFDPLYAVTTDIIAGFPGESSEDVQDSVRMIEEALFCKVHVFPYSKRPFTKAAELPNQIPAVEKKERSKLLAEAGERSAVRFFDQNKGQIRKVLLEERLEEGYLTGYTDHYVKAYLKSGDLSLLNTFVQVELTDVFRDGMEATLA